MKRFMELPHNVHNIGLNKVVSGRLKRLQREKKIPPKSGPFWQSSFFGLENSQLFLMLNEMDRHSILSQCSSHFLLESYFIEKIGMAFCARMSLVAETVESAQMYSLIGGDEATHTRWLSSFVPPADRTRPSGPFLDFLARIVGEGDPATLVFPLQIMLEGWGIEHYQSMARHCNDPDLQNVFENIVRDEALHHQAGISLFDPERLSPDQTAKMLDIITHFLDMVRRGPRTVAIAIETVSGHLNTAEKIRLLEDLMTHDVAARQLQQIKRAMMLPGYEKIIDWLESRNFFIPMKLTACLW